MKYAAYKFENKSNLRKAIEELELLSEKVPVKYDTVPGKAILVVPSYLRQHIDISKLGGTELKTRSFSDLDAKDQAKRRGLLTKKSA